MTSVEVMLMALCAAAVVVVVVTSISKLPSILCMLAVLVPNMDYRNNFGANCSMFAMKNVSNILNLLYNAIYVKKKASTIYNQPM